MGQTERSTDIYILLLLLSRFSRVRLCATPETAAHQAPPSLGFSRQEHWSGLPFSLTSVKKVLMTQNGTKNTSGFVNVCCPFVQGKVYKKQIFMILSNC